MMKLARLLFLFLILSVSGYAQTKIISGRVTDDKGIGLQGVSVKAINSGAGTTTAGDGSYSIRADEAERLEFSYVGFSSQTTTVGVRNIIDITLMPASTQNVEGVVVTALGIK
ncbi:MAG TPA: carboxypeptidase-like regulatory domain-containing protein, partial [Niabella sp.]|nr:carboxypeptidase-like regulatory domain-containing protein [Niabella sp.]